MVRLKVCIFVHAPDLLLNFNSTMVRLKEVELWAKKFRHRYFNSTMVRLKDPPQEGEIIPLSDFNSTMVRLKACNDYQERFK